MSTLLTKVRRTSARAKTTVAVLAAAIIVPAVVFAWGPTDRPTYTVDNPADHVTFNSITDNPDYGDERNFVRIKDAADTGAGNWSDELTVQPGKEYLVQMYVHNNAATSLNESGKGVATNTRVMANVPNTTGKSVQIDGFISADNASPKEVWDQAIFKSDSDFNVTYVNGSATMYNNHTPTGTAVNDSIVTSAGAPVGYDAMNGTLPGCFHYSGYVSFKVKIQAPKTVNFTVNKEVSKHGENKWVDNYTAKPGETIDYLIEYKNTGTTQQDNVVVKDKLPAGMEYINGSTKFGTKAQPNGTPASDNITKDGINIGSYAAGASTWVLFSAKVAVNDKLPACGANTLRNVARVEIDEGSKEDTADVTVNRECKPGSVTVCDLTSNKVITINEKDFDSNKHSKNLKDCKASITVCDTTTNTIVTINESDFDESKHSKDTSVCTTPDELPETGIDTGLFIFAGLSLVGASLGYAFTSERIRKLIVG
ncbi:MAG: LPXTG cell wall anchor domain-containing protein [Candidatus Saccharimonadales bacterium]